jgi:hypothetical protein
MTIAHVMAWHDTERNDYRALVDLVREDGYRVPGGAAVGVDTVRLGDWVMAIIADLAPDDVRTTQLGDMRRPSFAAVRAAAALQDMQGQGAI